MDFYKKEGVTAERPHLNLPEGTFEEEVGLEGFYGAASHLYHKNAPTSWSEIKRSSIAWPKLEEAEAEFLKPECYKSIGAAGDDFFNSAQPLFWNEDLSFWIHRFQKSAQEFFRNADASELYFLHSGDAILDSVFGKIDLKAGDYLVIPKGTTYRFIINQESYFFRLENFSSHFETPERGLLGQQALYHESGLRSPKFLRLESPQQKSVVRIQKNRKLTEISYDFDIRDLSGWFGNLYPWALSVDSIAPVVSPTAHLPPSINTTFTAKNFVVCTFLPRPLEEAKGALKVPFFHSNIDYDEIIFYHSGNFFSRDNMEAGYITLHSRGVNHGPHPKALASQGQRTHTDEVGINIDSVKPLKVTPFARRLELKDYWKSWMVKK